MREQRVNAFLRSTGAGLQSQLSALAARVAPAGTEGGNSLAPWTGSTGSRDDSGITTASSVPFPYRPDRCPTVSSSPHRPVLETG